MSRVQSICECQAILEAEIDERQLVVEGVARRICEQSGEQERAPANSVKGAGETFDVSWQCPFCGRNTLRTFR